MSNHLINQPTQQAFNFEGFNVRTLIAEDGEPWFVGKDVCDILGYSNPRDAIAKHVEIDDVAKRDAIDSLGRSQKTSFINESGLYALIFGSKLDTAKKFKKWVTSEVLPSIRKTGSYETHQFTDPSLRALQESLVKIDQVQNRISHIEDKMVLLDSDTGFCTITAYCKKHDYKFPITITNQLGRKATRLSQDRNIAIGRVADERFGSVNSYSTDLLDEIFSDLSS